MSKYDAQRALAIYKTFTKQTNSVVEFLSTARQYENATRLEIPKLKHAPTSLTSSLEEYLSDPDFEVNRRQYLAQQEAKKGGKSTSNGIPAAKNNVAKPSAGNGASKDTSEPRTVQAGRPPPVAKGPAPDLIDFFDSIEQNQEPMASAPQQQQSVPNFGVGPQYQQQQQLQQTGVLPPPQPNFYGQNGRQPQVQNHNSFGNSNPFGQSHQPQQQPIQPDFTGAGFGGYGQQQYTQQQNAFSNMPPNTTGQLPQQQQAFNTGQQSFSPIQQQQQQPFSTGLQQPMATGSNPFRQSMMPQGTAAPQSSFTSAPSMPTSPQTYQNTGSNPFTRNIATQPNGQPQNSLFPSQQGSPFTSPPPQPPTQPQVQQAPTMPPMTPHRTGTNPFARSTALPQDPSPFPTASPIVASPTGSTNPFRQSAFVNQQTGQGWQAGQGTMGGFEQLPTMPVFPRPGQPIQQQQQGSWP